MHGCYIVVIGGKQQQSVSLEIIVVVVALLCSVCATLATLSLGPIKQDLLAVKTGKSPLRHGVCVRQLNILLALNEITQ